MTDSKALKARVRLMAWEFENLPAADSIVGRQVFLHLLGAYLKGQTTSVKVLTSGLPYSNAAIRLQTRRLQSEGWLSVKPGAADGRQRIVELTHRTVTLLNEYDRLLRRQFTCR